LPTALGGRPHPRLAPAAGAASIAGAAGKINNKLVA
jgi:hypothetical protein